MSGRRPNLAEFFLLIVLAFLFPDRRRGRKRR
jgi:hypothetical protein